MKRHIISNIYNVFMTGEFAFQLIKEKLAVAHK